MEYVKLKSICQTTQGVQIPKNKQIYEKDKNYIRYLYIGDLLDDSNLKYVLNEFPNKIVTDKDLIMANTGSPGKVFLGKYGVLSNNLFKISFDRAKWDQMFLYYYLSSNKFQNNLQKQMKGGVQKHLGHQTIGEQKVPKFDILTQKRIVNILDQAQELIDKRKAQIEALDELVQSVFYDMFGDPVINEKSWNIDKFKNLGELKRGKSSHRPRNAPELLNGPYPLIQTGDIANAGLYIKEYDRTYSELGLQQSKMWPKGTLCITIAANIAKTGILTFDSCFPDSVVAFINDDNIVNKMYIQIWMSFLQSIIEESAPESAQKNINLKILGELDVIIPPIELQNQFAEIVENIEKQKELLNESLVELENNFNSLMQRAFSGGSLR